MEDLVREGKMMSRTLKVELYLHEQGDGKACRVKNTDTRGRACSRDTE